MPKAPAEQLVSNSLQGGLSTIAPVMENDTGTKGNNTGDRKKRRRGNGTKGGGAGEEHGQGKGSTGDRKGRKRERHSEALLLEQWERALWGLATGAEVRSQSSEATQVHKVRLTGTPEQDMP